MTTSHDKAAPQTASSLKDDPRAPWFVLLGGLAVLYGPLFWQLSTTIWASSQQGQGPIVLLMAIWLLWRKWPQWGPDEGSRPSPRVGWALIVFAGLLCALGRSQGIPTIAVGSLIPMLCGCVLLLRGPSQLRHIWFPLFFLIFMVPMPAAIVDSITQPMKLAVSYMADSLLNALGYPISKQGVMIQIGQYQLLVADACAGLNTLFTLEAVGLFYMNVVKSSSAFRNVTLALLIVPISFSANVVRVSALCLITYYGGDEAGQGFLHGFAGMVLFVTALGFTIMVDSLLRLVASGSRKVLLKEAS